MKAEAKGPSVSKAITELYVCYVYMWVGLMIPEVRMNPSCAYLYIQRTTMGLVTCKVDVSGATLQ